MDNGSAGLDTQPLCVVCAENGATRPDMLCAECAAAGSEWTGLWQAGIWLKGKPATTRDIAEQALAQLGWANVTVERLDPEAGVWLLTLPADAIRLLQTRGYVCQSTGDAQVEVELP